VKEKFLSRNRKFNPKNFFLSILNLATSTNYEGYNFALHKSWQTEGFEIGETPVKSSLSEMRDKISNTFFEDIWKQDLERLAPARKTYRGFYVYSVDGDCLDLPASKDIIENGFRGAKYTEGFETHYPKMYTAHAYDVINGLVCRFGWGKLAQSEIPLAQTMAKTFEANSIAIYDRLHNNHSLFEAHHKANNYFLARAKVNGVTIINPVKNLIASDKLDVNVDWRPMRAREVSLKLRLVKIKNPRTKEISAFITNLPKSIFSRKEIAKLYLRRWEVETSFRDITNTFKMTQFHSMKLNGILQEIFALLWMINAVKMEMKVLGDKDEDLLDEKYSRSNFKFCASLVLNNLDLLMTGQTQQLREMLKYWIKKTRENRKRLSRSYPRATKGSYSAFKSLSKIKRRPH
jgi:hypothetical protein